MNRRSVVFVDDDPMILEGLRTRLFRQKSRWDMQFIQSGREALAMMAQMPVDVIVSDMRMPEMDGAALLKKVQELHPRVVRIVLSGYAEMETALRAIPVAHQFLSKPCEAGVIENVVERACNLQSLINEDVVKMTVGRIDRLPSLPRVYSQLMTALENENICAGDIARILKQDMAMCAKILQIVNSAFFRLSRAISKVDEAVAYLGFSTIKQIVLAVEVFRNSAADQPGTRIYLEELQTHALAVGALAGEFFADRRRKEDAFVAGLLHDIGKLVLAAELPEHFAAVSLEMRASGCPMHQAEERIWGVTHAEVGGYLLGLWGLPYPVVEAVANHHQPHRVIHADFGIIAATHTADSLMNDAASALNAGAGRPATDLDMEYLEGLGVSGKLREWRELACRLTEGAG